MKAASVSCFHETPHVYVIKQTKFRIQIYLDSLKVSGIDHDVRQESANDIEEPL